ncbi:Uu.00g105010.m01.CDS01 [Anthostomella pinea]|uniref:Uu.00g105010.m01.CDS01 n=1 Tax=Anthostomella pinea TaxID=933095 RepID=A0AAI8VDT4_9PEZI|nr:Uu.00g105010.m01.CDS01 [Anthostomella pinea]
MKLSLLLSASALACTATATVALKPRLLKEHVGYNFQPSVAEEEGGKSYLAKLAEDMLSQDQCGAECHPMLDTIAGRSACTGTECPICTDKGSFDKKHRCQQDKS